MGRPLANSPVAMGLCVCPPDSLGPVWVACAVWSGQVSPSPLRVSTQCSASWPDGSTRLGLEPTVTTTTNTASRTKHPATQHNRPTGIHPTNLHLQLLHRQRIARFVGRMPNKSVVTSRKCAHQRSHSEDGMPLFTPSTNEASSKGSPMHSEEKGTPAFTQLPLLLLPLHQRCLDLTHLAHLPVGH